MKEKEKVVVSLSEALSRVKMTIIEVPVIHLSPLVYNAMSSKGPLYDALMPPLPVPKKEREKHLRHYPVHEFRRSMKTVSDESDCPTRLVFQSSAFKSGMLEVCNRVPDIVGKDIKQMVWVYDDVVAIYGVPQLYMAAVVQAGAAAAPDCRTRAIVPAWCTILSIGFAAPMVKAEDIASLLTLAGRFIGIGDGRAGKGKLTFGQYRIATMKEIEPIMRQGGRKQQDLAIAAKKPVCYDEDTRAMLTRWMADATARGFDIENEEQRAVRRVV